MAEPFLFDDNSYSWCFLVFFNLYVKYHKKNYSVFTEVLMLFAKMYGKPVIKLDNKYLLLR